VPCDAGTWGKLRGACAIHDRSAGQFFPPYPARSGDSGLSARLRRFHHVTYALDSREDILRAADVFLEAGVFIGQAWGLKTIESFHTHGTPPVEHK
jgi:hypothetical protein